MGFQFAQGGGDELLALREACGEGLDADLGALGERLDAYGEAHGDRAQAGVLGEVVADDGEPVGVRDHDVDHASDRERAGKLCQGARERSILRGIHREACFFLGGQALDRDGCPGRGPTYV